jgi:hypothetical protein
MDIMACGSPASSNMADRPGKATYLKLDFIHLVDKKRRQDKLISLTKEKSNAYLASRNYDRTDAIYASI